MGLLEASDPAQVRWVSPRSVDMHELAWWKFDAASLCAGLQRHFGRHSTSTSRRALREPRSWHRGREAVANARCKPRLDRARIENRPPRARRKRSTWSCQVASPARPARPSAARSGVHPAPRRHTRARGASDCSAALADRAATALISVCRVRADCLIRSTVAGQSSSSYVFAQGFARTTQTERDACAGPRPPLHSRQHARTRAVSSSMGPASLLFRSVLPASDARYSVVVCI